MVFGATTTDAKIPLIFINQEVKVTGRKMDNKFTGFLSTRLLRVGLLWKACAVRHPNLSSLRVALKKACNEIDADHVRGTVEAFPKRFRACVKEKNWIFES